MNLPTKTNLMMKKDLKIKKYPVAFYTGNIWLDQPARRNLDGITTCTIISTILKHGKR